MIQKNRLRLAVLLFAVVAALALFLPQTVEATGVGVWNSPPTFVSLNIVDANNEIAVIINASDYNGWADIYKITLTVYNPSGEVVQEAIYKQYATNTSATRIDSFEETEGRFLKQKNLEDPYSGSRVRRFSGVGWFEDNTTQEVTFLFHPFPGSSLKVEMEDTKGLVGVHEGPFSARYQAPPIFTNVVTPIGISIMTGSVAAAVAGMGRITSNRMARMIMRLKGGGL